MLKPKTQGPLIQCIVLVLAERNTKQHWAHEHLKASYSITGAHKVHEEILGIGGFDFVAETDAKNQTKTNSILKPKYIYTQLSEPNLHFYKHTEVTLAKHSFHDHKITETEEPLIKPQAHFISYSE